MIKQAVILCAGKGSRLGDLTKDTPKPLVEVRDKPFLEYSIDKLISISVTDIILIVEYLKWNFSYLQYKYPMVVRFKDDEEDTNRAVLDISNLRENFLLLNGDCYPVMNWIKFLDREYLGVCVQDNGHDAGCAIVSKEGIQSGLFDCANIGSMSKVVSRFGVKKSLSIDTPEKLESVRDYMKTVGV